MRIAHVSDCYLPRTGGIETQVRSLALQQAADGDDVRIITATPGDGAVFAGSDVVDGLRVERVAAHLPFDLPVHPRTRREVGRLLSAEPVDVVHVHAGAVSPFAWGAVRAAVQQRIPTLVTVHSIWGPVARPGFGISDALLRWNSWGVQLSAVSGVAARHIAAAVPRAGEVLIVPNGIDPAAWTVTPVPGEPGELRVLAVMRMAPRKRTLPLVKILGAASRALDGGLRATLVGDGPERRRAEEWVRGNGLAERIRFAGRCDRVGVLSAMAHADVFVQPSVRESFGIAALEARTAGLPVVARRQTGTTEFIHDGVEGLIADDDVGLMRAIVRLGHDRALCASIADHNRAVAPAEAWPSVLVAVRAAYEAAGTRVG